MIDPSIATKERQLEALRQHQNTFEQFKQYQMNQKMRGLNDFNIFTTLLSVHDEVRLHSSFLAAMLNPKGSHAQGSLFLKLFLQPILPENFNFDYDGAFCRREFRGIDIFISDGSNHVIVENKVYATDQHNQVQRYIETVKKQYPNTCKVCFCYLTLDTREPSKHGLGKYEINARFLRKDDEKIDYKNITYKEHLLVWLDACHQQVQNLKNISVALEQYREVVQKLTGQYRSKLMSLNQFLQTELKEDERREFIAFLFEAQNSVSSLRDELMIEFFDRLKKSLSDYLHENSLEGWVVSIADDTPLSLKKRLGFKFKVHNNTIKKAPIVIGIEFDKNDFKDMVIGVVRTSKDVNLGEIFSDQISLKAKSEKAKSNLGFEVASSAWWLAYHRILGDFPKLYATKNGEVLLNEVDSKIKKLIDGYAQICDSVLESSPKNITP